jgi:serine/threonine protein kinase
MDGYIKGQMLGRGAFGKTYLAKDYSTGNLCCLKKIFTPEAHLIELLNDEIEILISLHHHHVARFYKHFVEGEDHFLVFEFFEGESLKDFIAKQTSPPTETLVLSFAKQLTQAIMYCHKHKIIHRDLNPANILLTKVENLKLIDFGLAQKVDFAVCDVVSLPYMAPEIVKGEDYSFPVDVWGLGCILYELMMLKRPFPSTKRFELERQIVEINPPSITGSFSPLLIQTVMQMLEKNPISRITFDSIQSILCSLDPSPLKI